MAALGWSVVYLSRMKPPRCDDTRTLALVGYQLAQALAPMSPPQLARIKTVAGGELAIRFICSADFANPDRIRLPDGTVIRELQFTSTLAGPHHAQQVSIRLEPIPVWEQVQ